jgi:acetyl-CoA acetyltransferase
MREVAIIGAGMTAFGRWPAKSSKELAREAALAALAEAELPIEAIELAAVGNAVSGWITGQQMVLGQVVLRAMGIGAISIINVENACASSSSAFHSAWLQVASGEVDVALVLGLEKLFHPDKERSLSALASALDLDEAKDVVDGAGGRRSAFMDLYAAKAREHMSAYGTTADDLARVVVKSRANGARNPLAQFREPTTLEAVLAAPSIVAPFTRPMCSPIGDGAAALVLCSAERARRSTTRPVYVAASVLVSGARVEDDPQGPTGRAAARAYQRAGAGPTDLDVVELHDAAASAEILESEELGLCARGEGAALLASGATQLDGRLPINPSGGLLSRGHPIGATGAAQLVEVFWQLRGSCGARQVKEGRAKLGLTQNAGGLLGGVSAAVCVHVLKR